jgi:hypothetical protein
MIVAADPDSGRVEVRDVDDLARLSLHLTREASVPELQGLLAAWGTADTTSHVMLSVETLRTAAGRGRAPAWHEKFDAMVDYARSKGWMDGDSLRVHTVVSA